MDAVVLTWRWQNLLTIWLMIIALWFASTFASQMKMRLEGSSAASKEQTMLNTGLIKSPMNWLLIGFAIFMLSFAFNVIVKD